MQQLLKGALEMEEASEADAGVMGLVRQAFLLSGGCQDALEKDWASKDAAFELKALVNKGRNRVENVARESRTIAQPHYNEIGMPLPLPLPRSA